MGLLGRAKSMMQGWAAAPPSRVQFYSVACSEGHRLNGQRTEGYQALRCPTCGEGIFVLPRSPLPEPPAPAGSPRARVASAVEAAFPEEDPLILSDPSGPSVMVGEVKNEGDRPEAEIDWVDEIATEPEVPKAVAPPKPAVKPRPKPSGPSRPKVEGPKVQVVARPSLRESAWRSRNGLLVATVLVLIVSAVAIRWHRQRLEELPRIAEIGRTEGLKKLDAGEFQAAKKLLGEAADAVDGLGGKFEGADSIRQGAREAAIFADLAPAGIAEIVEEAKNCDPKEWPSRFAASYKGRSVIIDATVSAVPDLATPGSTYQIEYPIYFGRGPKPEGRGRINLEGFRLFELAQPKVGEKGPFAARYKSVELDVTTEEWVVTFEPDSGVFILHPKALEAIDWPSSEEPEGVGP